MEKKSLQLPLYQDLDGCLADFHIAIATEIKRLACLPEVERESISSGTLRRGIRKYLRFFDKEHDLSKEDLHHKSVKPLLYKIGTSEGFFANLPQIDNGLWEYISQYRLSFLTAPIGSYAEEDKKKWCRETLGSSEECIVVSRSEKVQYAKGSILIDDHPDTIREWNKAGGQGFLWTDDDNCLEDLKQWLNKFV